MILAVEKYNLSSTFRGKHFTEFHFVVHLLLLPIRSMDVLHMLAYSTVIQTKTKSRGMYQPIASLHFLVCKPQFSDGLVNLVQRKTI